MSLLWPEDFFIGLFPGRCWIRRGKSDLVLPADPACARGGEDVLAALDAMLAAHRPARARRARLHLIVSDGIAAQVALPWQRALTAEAELQGYAQACFERQGMTVDDSWTVKTTFRHYQAPGWAYAVPAAWLRNLLALLASRDLRLGSVLPVSAAAYCRHRPAIGAGPSLLLLRESRRVSAMVYQDRRLLGWDVEPVTADSDVADARLLRRIAATHGGIARAAYWSGGAPGPAREAGFIKTYLPDAAIQTLARDIWS